MRISRIRRNIIHQRRTFIWASLLFAFIIYFAKHFKYVNQLIPELSNAKYQSTLRLVQQKPLPSSLIQQRSKARQENVDEFVQAILENVTITEAHLGEITSQVIYQLDKELAADRIRQNPSLGADGFPSILGVDLKEISKKSYDNEGFNRLLSDHIIYNRRLRDLRIEGCSNESYDEALPTTSVVIVFSDEAFSTLIRTVTSVFNRTPAHLLSDIILIDDFSTRAHLKGKLERYLSMHFPVEKIRLARTSQRVGLIKARMLGGHLATGGVITFIDSHCEVLEHWIEPLLQRIKDDRTVIPCPQMDFIDPDTLEIYTRLWYPAFFWRGDFYWSGIPQEELKRRSSKHSPIRTPVMVGCMFAVDRKYFWEIGSFDPGMEKWGGENLEIGFRVWQCGGSIEMVPCSHVAHMAKKFTPYKGKLSEWPMNTARAARVWMDQYQDILFSFWPALQNKTIDVTSRLAFRQRKNCKSFKWYMDNVYPSKFQMQFDSKYYGQVRNKESGYCLDAEIDIHIGAKYVLSIRPCLDSFAVHQTFFISNDNKLRRENECAVPRDDQVEMIPCNQDNNSTMWDYRDLQLVVKPVNMCAAVIHTKNGTLTLGLQKCDVENSAQQWNFNSTSSSALQLR